MPSSALGIERRPFARWREESCCGVSGGARVEPSVMASRCCRCRIICRVYLPLSVAGRSTGQFVCRLARQQPYSWLPRSSAVFGMSELGGTSQAKIREPLTAVNWSVVRHFTAPAVSFEKLWSRPLAEYYAWRRTCHHRVPDEYLCWPTWSPRHVCPTCVQFKKWRTFQNWSRLAEVGPGRRTHHR